MSWSVPVAINWPKLETNNKKKISGSHSMHTLKQHVWLSNNVTCMLHTCYMHVTCMLHGKVVAIEMEENKKYFLTPYYFFSSTSLIHWWDFKYHDLCPPRGRGGEGGREGGRSREGGREGSRRKGCDLNFYTLRNQSETQMLKASLAAKPAHLIKFT